MTLIASDIVKGTAVGVGVVAVAGTGAALLVPSAMAYYGTVSTEPRPGPLSNLVNSLLIWSHLTNVMAYNASN